MDWPQFCVVVGQVQMQEEGSWRHEWGGTGVSRQENDVTDD
jgi:hypothetical protein